MDSSVVLAAVAALSYPWRTRAIAALSLAQVGEFSFVLIHVGNAHGLLDPWYYQIAIASVVLTMLVTPALVAAGPRLFRSRTEAATSSHDDHAGHVVIVGFGLTGRYVAQALKQNTIDYTIIELNGRSVRRAREEGEPIIFGDATRYDILEHAEVHHARVAVFAITDPTALRDAIRRARAMAPELHIIARTRFLGDVDDLEGCGADVVVVEEVEASIKLLGITLTTMGLPDPAVRGAVLRARKDLYPLLRDLPAAVPDSVMQALETLATRTFRISEDSPHLGRTLREMDLGRQTGARVLSIARGETSFPNPSADRPLEGGDVLVLVGSHEEIRMAEVFLQTAVSSQA